MEQGSVSDDEFAEWTKSGNQFDPIAYVDSIWNERVIPSFQNDSTDVVVLLDAIGSDRDAAIQQYGRPISSGATVGAFKTRGTGVVVDHDDTSRNGIIRVALFPQDSGREITIQIGPVIRKTAIRDSLTFIRFSDIGNQLQFAALGDELNARMRKESVQQLELETIEGKTIDFLGAFTIEEGETSSDLVVTPVEISVVDGAE